LRHIARENLRWQLSLAQAMRMSSIVKEDWEAYQRDLSRLTEVPKHG
jgi:hypothetical protein